MARARRSLPPPPAALVASDAMALVLSVGPGAVAWALALLVAQRLVLEAPASGMWLPVLVAAAPASALVVAVSTLLLTLWWVRLALPALKPGLFPVGPNRGVLAWSMHMALARALRVSGLAGLVSRAPPLWRLYLRALGLQMPPGARVSPQAVLLELPLIGLGAHAQIEAGTVMTCHTFVGDKLVLRPITLGDGARVGSGCRIGPSTRIGARAVVGQGNFLAADRVPDDGVIADLAWATGNPRRKRRADPGGDDAGHAGGGRDARAAGGAAPSTMHAAEEEEDA
jgi:serine acetyltransferase